MSPDDLDVAIIGGGICGLATALAFSRRGWTPTVYEAASEYRPIGGGLLLQTNALLALDRLGVADRVRDAGVPLTHSVIRSAGGRVLKRLDVDALERERFGYGFVAVHRAELQRILLDELDAAVEMGTACEAVTDADTDTPTVRFADGSRVRPNVVVGTDGIDSVVRDVVAPGVEPRPLDWIAYRAVTRADLPERYRTQGVEVWGDGTYAGGAPIHADRFYWFATAPRAVADRSVDPSSTIAALRERYAAFPEPIPTVVDATGADEVFVTGLTDVPSLETWSRGSVVVAGDAAHGMLPFAGQGAAQAIEDAPTLAHAVDTCDDLSDALDAFETERKPRADRIRAESRGLGRLGMIRSTVGSRARNLAMRLFPDVLFRRLRHRRAADASLP